MLPEIYFPIILVFREKNPHHWSLLEVQTNKKKNEPEKSRI